MHAIGAGVSLIEVQQNSNITYRLYDYGRPRELHLDEGLAAATGEPYARERWHKRVPSRGSCALVDGPLFLLDQIDGCPSNALADRYPGEFLVIPRSGSVEVDGEMLPPGTCGPAQTLENVRIPASTVCLVARSCAQDDR